MGKRTMTKHEWRQRQMNRPDADGRMAWAYDWVRAMLSDLGKRRHPDPAVRAQFAELRARIPRQVAAHLNAQRELLDDAIPADVDELARRLRMRRDLDAAQTDMERMRYASNWYRSSIKILGKRRWSVSSEELARRTELRERVLNETADFLAGLAELAEGCGQ